MTESVAKKQMILAKLKDGHWVLDLLSPSILKKIIEDQKFLNTKNEITDITLKSYAIFYYCQIKSPLTILFYDKAIDQNFNQIILNKIAKEGLVDNFTYEEQEKIVDSLNRVQALGATGISQFAKELSFIKMNSMQFRSATTPHLIGAIILTNQINYNDSYELSRSIVHELAHHELFLINFYDRLTLENTDGINVFSPYQKIERPPIGRLHSLWAIFRMIQYGKLVGRSVQKELALFNQTIQTLENNIMTDFGAKLINTARDHIENN